MNQNNTHLKQNILNNYLKEKTNFKPIILFDVDGTLVDGSSLHIRAFYHAIKSVYGIVPSIDWKKVAGKTDLWILHDILIENGVSEETYNSKVDLFTEEISNFYKEHIKEENYVHLLPGIKILIEDLKNQSYLGLVTGNIEQIARLKLKKAGLDYEFQFGGFGNENFDRSVFMKNAIKKAISLYNLNPDLAFLNSYYVADTPYDVEAARKAKVKSIIVLTGYNKKNKFKNYKPDLFINSFESKEERYIFKQFVGLI